MGSIIPSQIYEIEMTPAHPREAETSKSAVGHQAVPSSTTLEALQIRELRAPRYTSYPTALSMSEGVEVAQVLDELRQTNEEPIPGDLSLYIHVPFCAAACFYCGCNRTISRRRSRHAEYLQNLKAEIGMIARRVRADRTVRQVHFGGGTPNMLPAFALHGLMDELRSVFNIDPDGECSLEVDPRQARLSDLAQWRSAGFNRVSMGVQDLDPQVQTAINREQSTSHIEKLIRAARAAGFSGINLDLIIGLPKQTLERFLASVEQVAAWQPERVALFQYAHMPERFPAQRAIANQDLPSMSLRFEMQQLARELLIDAGYQHIGMDHFALPEDELAVAQRNGRLRRNFQGYSVLGDADLLGFGVSAISQIGRAMVQNTRDIRHYEYKAARGQLAWSRGLLRNADDVARAEIIEELMCHGHTERADPVAYADAWERLDKLDPNQQWVRRGESHWTITPAGRDFQRLIAQCFDVALPAANAAQQQAK